MLGHDRTNATMTSSHPLRVEFALKRLILTTVVVVLGVVVSWIKDIAAAPYVPANDTQVLERFPVELTSSANELDRLRETLAARPQDLTVAVSLARLYLDIGRAEGDPRYSGYAQAILKPWWNQPYPPPQVRLIRATLRQRGHDFESALKDISQLIEIEPRNGQAWLTQAVIQQVRGNYAAALRSCLVLARLSPGLAASACTASVTSLNGRAESSYRLLQQALTDNPSADERTRLWSLTILAEIAVRLGLENAAEAHFRQALALGVRDVYLLSAFADFLLDQDRAKEVQTLLKEDSRPDALLLRLALAEKRLNSPRLSDHREALRARFAAARLRGTDRHLRSEARFSLHLLNQPAAALRLAQKNWSVQREPADSRILLEASLAAGDLKAAQPVLDFLALARLEDRKLALLAENIEVLGQ